jgi:tRNA pseudouridine38-40 synthase
VNYRYFIFLSYDGTNYCGWQVQPNAITVQEKLNKALETILKHTVVTLGAGRTDTGVHARFFVAHFDSDHDNLHLNLKIVYQLNRLLPNDIAIQKITKVKPEAHARFDATARSYEYTIAKNKNPFLQRFSYQYDKPLNIDLLNECASVILQNEDFQSFCKYNSDNKTHICKVTESQWIEYSDKYIFYITANRFLRNMVRALVGTMLEVEKGKISINDFKSIFSKKDRIYAGQSAKAEGLALTNIIYPEDLNID